METTVTPVTIDFDGAHLSAMYGRPSAPVATLVVAPGAGSGMDHPFLVGFTRAMNDCSVATLRFNFPYREAGRRFPDRAPVAIGAWHAALDAAVVRSDGEPIWAGGKSFGGRMASMAVAAGMPATGLVFLGYPLHPPGRPESLRDDHLYGIRRPMLFVQGKNDPFATGSLLDEVVERIGRSTATLEWLENADHSFAVKGVRRGADQVGASLAPLVAEFMRAQD